MTQRRKLFGALVAVLFLVGFATPAGATHSWGGYHWARASNPVTVELGTNVDSTWGSYLAAASSDWSASDVLDAPVKTGATDARKCRPTSGRVEVCNARYGNTGWLGVAQIWASGTHITQGTVKVNDFYFDTSTYNSPEWRQMVMCQEVGHTFGLDHQDENFNNTNLGTCMDYTNDPGRNDGSGDNLHPNQHDYDELDIIYSHTDSTGGGGGSGGHGKGKGPNKGQLASTAGAGNSQSDWGQAVRYDADGRPSLFEQDLGNGQRVFTFVTWAR